MKNFLIALQKFLKYFQILRTNFFVIQQVNVYFSTLIKNTIITAYKTDLSFFINCLNSRIIENT